MIIICILLVFLLVSIFLLIKSSSWIWKIAVIVILIATIFGAFFINIPIGIRHLANQIISPKDLYEPIVLDQFDFYNKGYTKKYKLDTEYSDIYELGILACDSGIPSKYKFKGKLKAVFEMEGKCLVEKNIISQQSAVYLASDMTRYRKIALENFEIPLLGTYQKGISLTLTVIEPDIEIEKYKDCVRLYIAVSDIP